MNNNSIYHPDSLTKLENLCSKLLQIPCNITRKLGEGASSQVFCLTTKNLRSYALKLIILARNSPSSIYNAYKEIFLLRKLCHPNIIKVIATAHFQNLPIIIVQHAQCDLRTILQKQKPKLPITCVMEIAYALYSALTHCHANLIAHNDIKAENILIQSNGNVILADFAYSTLILCKSSRNQKLTRTFSTNHLCNDLFAETNKFQKDFIDAGMLITELLVGTDNFHNIANQIDEIVRLHYPRRNSSANELAHQLWQMFQQFTELNHSDCTKDLICVIIHSLLTRTSINYRFNINLYPTLQISSKNQFAGLKKLIKNLELI